MGVYIFKDSMVINYIFPYSFAMIYAATFFTYSVLFFLLYIKNDNIKWAYISCFLLGLSFANKPEFVLSIIPFVITFIIKRTSLKTNLYSMLLFVLPITFSYAVMFMQGFTIEDLKSYISFTKSFFNSYEQIYYNMTTISPNWSLAAFYRIGKGLMSFLYFLLCSCVCFYTFKIKKSYFWLILPAYMIFSYNFIVRERVVIFFSWTIIATVIILFLLLKNINDKKHYMLFLLSTTAILSCARINYIFVGYGYYIYFLFPLLAVYLYVINFIPDIRKIQLIKKYVSVALIVLSIYCIYCTKIYSGYLLTLKTDKGTIKSMPSRINAMKYMINWINTNTKPTDTVLILPEGAFANFITGRPTKTLYYHLIPNHLSALGEENVVNGLKKDSPKYIIIEHTREYYHTYGKYDICYDWGYNVCKFISENYKEIDEVSNKNMPMFYNEYSTNPDTIIPLQIYENISDL